MSHATPSSPADATRSGRIAIVGVSALFPGSLDKHGFWRDICAGSDLLSDVPPSHWLVEDYYDPDPSAPDKTYAKRGAFLNDVDFDALSWGVPPSIMEATDTSQLLSLIVAQRVLDEASAGQFAEMDKSRISVILGVTSAQELLAASVSRLQRPMWVKGLRDAGVPEDEVEDICERIAACYTPWQESTFPGLLGNVVAGRIANRLDLGGTNCVTDAACASTFSAIQMGVSELLLGDSDLVVAGGVDTLNDIFMFMCFSKTPALSRTGDCRPFSAHGDGTMLGEGIGMFALKRLEDAERDGDAIYAVLCGVGTSSDGRSKSVYAPVSKGQSHALRRAYDKAGYAPSTVELVEAHGTGTVAGDAAEFDGLRMVFDEHGDGTPWCALGSVKSQIGHTKAAAGAAGLFKAVMALHHRTLPPTLKVSEPNPKMNIEESAFYLNTDTRPWIRPSDHPRRASVSSFGFGGSNFHITLEEYTGENRPGRLANDSTELFVVCGATGAEVANAARALATERPPTKDAFRWLARRSHAEYNAASPARLALVASDFAELERRLTLAATTIERDPEADFALPDGSAYGVGAREGEVAFLFPGQGSQHVGMGGDLAMRFDACRAVWDRAADLSLAEDARLDQVVYPRPSFDPEAPERDRARLTTTEWAQPAIGAASLAQLSLLRALGLKASMMTGHSFGELSALAAAGAMDESTLLRMARTRGELMAKAAQTPGAMLAVPRPIDEVRALIERFAADVVVANHNHPEQVVVSGSVEAIAAFQAELDRDGLEPKRLPVATAFHSPIVSGSCVPFREALAALELRAPDATVFSGVSAAAHSADPDAIRDALADQIASPIRFVDTIEAMYASGARVFVEVGPKAVLTGLTSKILGSREHVAVSMERKGKSGHASFLLGLAQLAAAGVPLDLTALRRDEQTPADPADYVAPRLAIPINGSNYGKPYPPKEGAAGRPKPNPPRASAASAAHAPSRVSAEPAAAPPRVAAAALPETPAPAVPSTSPAATRASIAGHAPTSSPTPTPTQTPTMTHPNGTPPYGWAPQPQPGAWYAAFSETQRRTAEIQAMYQASMAQAHAAYLQMAQSSLMSLAGAPVHAAAPYAPAPMMQQMAMPMPPMAPAPMAMPHAPAQAMPAQMPPAQMPPVQMPPVQHQAYAAPPAQMPLVQHQAYATPPAYPAASAPSPTPSFPWSEDHAVNSSAPGPQAGPPAAVSAPAPAPVATSPAVPAPAAPTPAQPVAAPSADVNAVMLAVVADSTGYPAEMLEPGMALEGDLGIDSIKRVEILSAVQDQIPGLPDVDANHMGTLETLGDIVEYMQGLLSGPAPAPAPPAGAAPASSAAPQADVNAVMLAVVADSTGYPAEMLEPGMALEGDLGIDSIKRVEILSAVQDQIPGLPEVDANHMGTLETLGDIVEYMQGLLGDAPAAEARPFDQGAGTPSLLGRYELELVPAPASGFAMHGLRAGAVCVSGDSLCGPALAASLEARGVRASYSASPAEGARAVVFVGPVCDPLASAEDAASANALAFRAARVVARSEGDAPRVFVSIQGSGGGFGLRPMPEHSAWCAGLAGLTRTSAHEWDGASVRAIDIEVGGRAPEALAVALADELLHGGAERDVALTASGERFTLRSVDRTVSAGDPVLNPEDVVVVSGGARGVTAACVIEWARSSGATFVLLGRTPLAEEPACCAGALDDASIKRALLLDAKARGDKLAPAEVRRQAKRVLASREVRATLGAVTAAGGRARYVAASVTDANAVKEAFESVRAELGPITGVVHAAGVLADKFIADKSDEDFAFVFDTKIDGLRVLLDATASDTLKVLSVFSSVAARCGNRGQCDYAMANEVLAKVCLAESQRRPECVVRSFGWGPWEGGMVTPALEARFAAMGVTMIPLAQGARMFVDEMVRGGSTAVDLVLGGEPKPEPLLQDDAAAAPVKLGVHVSAVTHPHFADHAIQGAPVVPVVAVIDWFQRALGTAFPDLPPQELSDVRVLRGMRLDGFDGAGDSFVVELTREGERVAIRLVGGDGTPHYRASATRARSRAENEGAPAAPAGAWGERPVYGDVLFHGERFQVIDAVDGISDEGAAATLCTGRGAAWPQEPWSVDVAGLDGGLQLALLYTEHVLGGASLPMAIESFRTFAPMRAGDPTRCIAVRRSLARSSATTDIVFLSADGTRVAEMNGVRAVLVPA